MNRACRGVKRIVQHPRTALAIIVFGGLSLRLYGIDFGLPYLYGEDEATFVNHAVGVLAARDLDPHWFGHPGTTTIYMLSALYGAIFTVGLGLGTFASAGDFAAFWAQNPAAFYLSGRLLIAVSGLATLPLVYAVARRLFNRSTGLLAATLLALSPLHVHYSKLIRADIQMTFLVLVAFWLCLEILERQSWTSYVLAGFVAGLATVTKYPAVIVTLTIVMASISGRPWRWAHVPKLLGSGAASLLGAFIGSPFLFLDFGAALSDASFEVGSRHLGAIGDGLLPDLAWYLQGPLSDALSTCGVLLSVVGSVLCVASGRRDRWLLVGFPVFFLVFIASLTLRWERWIVPAIPFLCILAAYAIYTTARWIGTRWDRRAGLLAGCVLLLGMAVPPLRADLLQGREMSNADTRTLAREWMVEHVPAGSRLLMEIDAPQVPTGWYRLFKVTRYGELERLATGPRANIVPVGQIGDLKDIDAVRRERVEYMVLSDLYDRYLAERRSDAAYALKVETYEALMGRGHEIHEIKRIPGRNRGPTLRIYRFDGKQ